MPQKGAKKNYTKLQITVKSSWELAFKKIFSGKKVFSHKNFYYMLYDFKIPKTLLAKKSRKLEGGNWKGAFNTKSHLVFNESKKYFQ